MKPLAHAWQTYMDKVMPKNAGPLQIVETKRAFYAGAMAFFTAVTFAPEMENERSEADGVAHPDALYRELLAFLDSIPKG